MNKKTAIFAIIATLAAISTAGIFGGISHAGASGFDWAILQNGFDSIDCPGTIPASHPAATFKGVITGMDILDAINGGVHMRFGAYHSDTAGCSPTTEGTASGVTVDRQTFDAIGQTFTVTFNTAVQPCGRVQIDGDFRDSNNNHLKSFAFVFNYGINCTNTQPTPTPTPSHTPTPTPSPTPSPTPTPTPSPTPLIPTACSPAFQTVSNGQVAHLTASGGNGIYIWSAPNGSPPVGLYRNFDTQYFTNASSADNLVTVTSGSTLATCTVRVINNIPTANLGISKTVRNLTTNSAETKNVVAQPGDTVEFIIRVSANGNIGANNVRLYDNLPSQLNYINGTTAVDGISYGDGITSNGLFLGTLGVGRIATVRFQARVAPETSFIIGTTNLTNSVTAYSDNTASVADSASIAVIRSGAVINPILQLQITKLGKNVTRGQASEQNLLSVSSNDTLEFDIHVRSLSSITLYNVIVSDSLPSGLTYISRTTSLNNIITVDGITAGGINIGSLAPNQEVIVKFNATVDPGSIFPSGTLSAINISTVRADGIAPVSAQLSINRGSVLGASTVQTGPAQSTLIALVLSALVTWLYITYVDTNIFRRRQVLALAHQYIRDPKRLNFSKEY